METNCNMNSQEIPSYSSIITSEIEALTKLWKIVSRPVMLNLNKAQLDSQEVKRSQKQPEEAQNVPQR